jgi:YHS domain-containing protein
MRRDNGDNGNNNGNIMSIIFRLLRILFAVLIGFFIYRLLFKKGDSGLFKKKKKKYSWQEQDKAIAEMKKDPICGTYIPENQAIRYKDEYFCSKECKEKFISLQTPH